MLNSGQERVLRWSDVTDCFHRAEARRGIAMNEMSVRPLVRPSVKRVNCEKTKETCANILTSQEKLMHLVLQHEERLMGMPSSI